jgi:hypothetical protein
MSAGPGLCRIHHKPDPGDACESITWGKLTDVMRIWPGDPYPLGAAYDGAVVLPKAHRGMWTCVLDTTTGYALEDEETAAMAGEKPMVEARSIQVLRRV